MFQSHDILTGPALRLELVRLLAPVTGDKVVEIATAAESYIIGALAAPDMDDQDADDRSLDATIMLGAAPIEETDHHRPVQALEATPAADAGTHEDGGKEESGDPAPAQGPGQEDTAQELTSSPPSSRRLPKGHVQWTADRKAKLRALCVIGLEAKEIEGRMGLTNGSASANVYRFGWIDLWREARERRRAGKPMPERAVPAGESWAFTENKTLAAETKPKQPPVEIRTVANDAPAMAREADRPVPPLPVSDESRLIEEHIKAKGVTTAEADYGPDQPAVDALRRAYNDVVRSNDPKSPWLVNGQRLTTSLLWKRANAELKTRREKPIKRRA